MLKKKESTTMIEQWSLQDALIETGTGFVGGLFVGLAPSSAATLRLTGGRAALVSLTAPAVGTTAVYTVKKTASGGPLDFYELVPRIGSNYILSYVLGGFSPALPVSMKYYGAKA